LGDATRRSKTPHVPRVTQDDDLQQNLLVVLACHFVGRWAILKLNSNNLNLIQVAPDLPYEI
jgi:hypothetical protein